MSFIKRSPIGDANDAVNGIYYNTGNMVNCPSLYGILVCFSNAYTVQLFFSVIGNNSLYTRKRNDNGTWEKWNALTFAE